MTRTKKETNSSLLDVVKEENKAEEIELAIEDMPLDSLGDYVRYNARARAANKKLKIRRYPIHQCPEELHPKQRIVFGRVDQPSNPLQVYLSNELIDFKQKLIPGQTYDLPLCVIDYLAQKGTPVWDWVVKPDGSKETYKVSTNPRFTIRNIYKAG